MKAKKILLILTGGTICSFTTPKGEDILQALKSVLYEPDYKNNAIRISDSFHACGGVVEARKFLEEIAHPNHSA